MTLTFCRCLTYLKQNALHGLLYAALQHGDMIGHICITDMTSLISFLLILFHSWAAFVEYQQNWVNNSFEIPWQIFFQFIIFRLDLFGSTHGSGCRNAPFPKIYHFYPTVMKFRTDILYLTKIQNIYKSRETPIKFFWHQYFFSQKSATLVISRNTDIDCSLIHDC